MQIVPITEVDVYRATLAACVVAEGSDQRALAKMLRAWVDDSPFGGCPTCHGRSPAPYQSPCDHCRGNGFVPDPT